MGFSDAEVAYLRGQRLGRLATIGPDGAPQVRPVGFRLNDDGTIDVGGPNMASSRKYRNVQANPRVSFVVDDMTPDEPGALQPGWGRGVEVRGRGETRVVDVPPLAPGFFSHDIVRIHPQRVVSWHVDPAHLDQHGRDFV